MTSRPPDALLMPDAPALGDDCASELVTQARALRTSSPVRGAALAAQAVALLQPLGPSLALAAALDAQGHCLRNASDLLPALACSQQAVALHAESTGKGLGRDPAAAAQAQINLGVTLTMLGRHQEALHAFEAALALSRSVGDVDGEADALLDIAIVANLLGDDARAVALYEQVLPIYRQLGDDYHAATTLNNQAYALVCWGSRCAQAGDLDAARRHWQQAVAQAEAALPLAEASDHPDFVVSCMDTLSSALRELGELQAALDRLQQQLSAARRLDGRRMEAVTLATLGEVQRRLGLPAAALESLLAADALFQQLQLAEQHAGALLSLVALHESQGRPAEALAAYRRFHVADAQNRSQAAEQQMRALQTRLRLEHAEAELALSRQREAELAALNERLQAADRERATLMQELHRLSHEDALTGLPNRRALRERLQAEARRDERAGRPLLLALIDVDDFKQINDCLSHAVGDQVLCQLARLLRSALLPADLLARLGGDEFALLLPEREAGAALALCSALAQQVASHDWSAVHPSLAVTLSIGLGSVALDAALAADRSGAAAGERPDERRADSALPSAWLAQADEQLYRAKRQGRNQACGEGAGSAAA